ncbi:Fc.00g099100.m01.CDS01 [Cosmosporella sp. VM-42]
MVHLNTFLQLLSIQLAWDLPAVQATLSHQSGSPHETRNLELKRVDAPLNLETRHLIESHDGKPQMLDTLDLVRRLVGDKGDMVGVSEKDLQSILDQINTLQAQVKGMMSSDQVSNPPENHPNGQSGSQDEDQPDKSPAEGSGETSAMQLEATTSQTSIDQSTQLPGNQAQEPSQTPTQSQPAETLDDSSNEGSEGQSEDQSEDKSEDESGEESNKPSKDQSKESSTKPPNGQPTGILGGQFKESTEGSGTRPSKTAFAEPAKETSSEPPAESTETEPIGSLEEDDPSCSVDDLSSNSTESAVSGIPLIRRDTNCAAKIGSATDAAQQTSGAFIPSATSAELAPSSAMKTFVASLEAPPTNASSTEAVQDGSTAFSLSQQVRTLVVTSTLTKNSTITITSMHTVLIPLQPTGSSNGTGFLGDQNEGGTGEDGEEGNEDGEGAGATESSLVTAIRGPFANTTMRVFPSTSGLMVVPGTNTALGGDPTPSLWDIPVFTAPNMTAPNMAAPNMTIGIIRRSNFKTVLKPTTSLVERTLE